jgi:tetratricopeptide (TPR) repeat protein
MRIKLFLLMLFPVLIFGQNTEKYENLDALFYKAEDLYLKQQYSAAREGFNRYLRSTKEKSPNFVVKARYYEAVCALELYHEDALKLFLLFLEDYPESKYRFDIYFRIARQYFNQKQFKDAIEWFEKIPAHEVNKEEKPEYSFKLGYSYFKREKFEQAKKHFFDAKDTESQYASPATYYYAHICYQNNLYETALEHFYRLLEEPGYDQLVPFYIAQIYHAQKEYQKVVDLIPSLIKNGNEKNLAELNQIIGDSYYRLARYEEAVPYLEAYYNGANTTREDDYQLAFVLMKTGNCNKAVKLFEKVSRKQDALGQAAFYHSGACYLELGNTLNARSAFEQASKMSFDPSIEEDALFQTAILSYELNVNPFDEAIKYFELYIEKYPSSVRRRIVFEYLVNVYMSTKNYEKALQSIDRIDPPSTRMKSAYQFLAYNKGIEEYTNGRFTEAIKSLELVGKYPMDNSLVARSRYWIADARFQLKQYNTAIEAYRFFLANSDNYSMRELRAEAHYNIGYALFHLNQHMAAITEFKKFIELVPIDERKKIADANLRIADCYYVESARDKSLSHEAIPFYQRVIDARQGLEDRALFYQARCYGFTNQREKQVAALNQLMNEYQSSPYRAKAIFEAGIVRRNQMNYAQSNTFFERILNEFPKNVLVKDALYELGVNHLRMGNFSTSETYFERLLKDFGKDDKTCKYATAMMVELYQKSGSPAKISQLAQRYPCSGITADYQDSLYFDTAYEFFIDSNFVQAINKFKDYLTAYPNGLQRDRANFLIAESYFSLNKIAEAYPYYIKVINSNATAYHEVSLIRAANYEYENQRYADAIQNYTRLAQIAANPYRMFGAQLGLMRCHFILENWTASLQAANFVLNSNLAQNSERMEARFCRGVGLRMTSQFNEAIPDLDFVAKNARNQMAVQAKFYIAEIYFEQNNNKESEKQIRELLQMRPSYDFWTAKALLLQVRNSMISRDFFQAEYTLNSVINNYSNQTDGILAEALKLREDLNALKNAPRDLPDPQNRVIEIKD